MTDTSPDSLQPVPKAITIFINGEPVRRNAPSDLALIDLLHEDLGLTGASSAAASGYAGPARFWLVGRKRALRNRCSPVRRPRSRSTVIGLKRSKASPARMA